MIKRRPLIHRCFSAVLFLLFSFFLPSGFLFRFDCSSRPFLFAAETAEPAGELPGIGTYDGLLQAIRGVHRAGEKRIEEAVRREKVREAWEIGKLIDQHVLQHKERAEYDKEVIPRLGNDLGMSASELYRMLKFYRLYPILAPTHELSWGHYRELLSVQDPEVRHKMAAEAVKRNWSSKELRRQIQALFLEGRIVETKLRPTTPLTAKLEKPHTYRIVPGLAEGELVIDLGFSNYYHPKSGLADFNRGDVVENKEGELMRLGSPDNPIDARDFSALSYTYEVNILKILDGDTISAAVDLGFGFTTIQTLRLRGIDAPEIESAEGKEAKETLKQLLSDTRVLIRTTRSDKYDRYLIDLFADGTYVNQALLDRGLAVRADD